MVNYQIELKCIQLQSRITNGGLGLYSLTKITSGDTVSLYSGVVEETNLKKYKDEINGNSYIISFGNKMINADPNIVNYNSTKLAGYANDLTKFPDKL